MVEDSSRLQFEDVSYDRRGFFGAMKNLAFLRAAGLFGNDREGGARSYSRKRLPLKRQILRQ